MAGVVKTGGFNEVWPTRSDGETGMVLPWFVVRRRVQGLSKFAG
jgi:hypothetical protein